MDNKEKNFASAVVYIHNDEKRIASFFDKLIDVLQCNFEHAEIICVNDNSNDDSVKVIKEMSQKMRGEAISISLLNLSYFHGIETAMSAGVDIAIGDFVFEFDSLIFDFEEELIMMTYRHSINNGYDIVSTVPNKKEKLSSRITVLYRKVVYMNCGLKTDSIRYNTVTTEKEVLDNKMKDYRTSLAIDSLILFTELGYKFSFAMTVFMMLISIAMVFYSAVIYFTSNPIEGWTTTILFLAVAFFGLFGILTIVIKYLQIIVDLIFKKKRYTFESVEKLN